MLMHTKCNVSKFNHYREYNITVLYYYDDNHDIDVYNHDYGIRLHTYNYTHVCIVYSV